MRFRQKKNPAERISGASFECLDRLALWRSLPWLGSAVLENPEPSGQCRWPDNAIKLALPFQKHKPQLIRAVDDTPTWWADRQRTFHELSDTGGTHTQSRARSEGHGGVCRWGVKPTVSRWQPERITRGSGVRLRGAGSEGLGQHRKRQGTRLRVCKGRGLCSFVRKQEAPPRGLMGRLSLSEYTGTPKAKIT